MKSFVILLLCFVQVTQQLQWQRLAEDVESKSETKMILITCHFMSIRGFTDIQLNAIALCLTLKTLVYLS